MKRHTYGVNETRNGARLPPQYTRRGGLCWQAWMHFDDCHEQDMDTADTATIIELGVRKGLNEGNLRTELGWWRKFWR